MSVASVTASSLVCGLSFQLPLMNGFLDAWRATVEDDVDDWRIGGAKADADPARARRERAWRNFMVALKKCVVELVDGLWECR